VPARSGDVQVDDTALLGMTTAQRVRFGLRRSFQTEQVVEDLSAWDNVQAMLDHVPHAHGEAQSQVHGALEHAGLLDCAAVPGAELDLFRRRMVEVAKALVGKPRLILFDEPGAGLDERESRVLRDAIAAEIGKKEMNLKISTEHIEALTGVLVDARAKLGLPPEEVADV